MKKIIFVGLFFILAVFSISAQERPSITIVNNTGYVIYYVYISPSESETWGSDCLGEEVLMDGESMIFRLPPARDRVYDIMLEDEDEDTYTKARLRLNDNTRVVFTFDDFDEYDY